MAPEHLLLLRNMQIRHLSATGKVGPANGMWSWSELDNGMSYLMTWFSYLGRLDEAGNPATPPTVLARIGHEAAFIQYFRAIGSADVPEGLLHIVPENCLEQLRPWHIVAYFVWQAEV